MPAACNAGDLKLVLFSNDGGDTVTLPSGWTSLYSLNSGTLVRGGAYARIHQAGDPSTVDFVTSGVERAAAQCFRISGWYGTIAGGVEAATAQALTTANPDPSSFSPSWGSADNLWIVAVGSSSGATLTSPPSGYANSVSTDSGSTTNGAQQYSARKTATAASDDPGVWTFSTSQPCIFSTIAVRGAAETGVTVSPVTAGASDASSSGATALGSISVPAKTAPATDASVPGSVLGPASPPTAWWKFDETSGAAAADSSGNGNTATLYGTPTFGDGIALDGTDYIGVTSSDTTNATGDFTVALWLKTSQAGASDQYPIVIMKDGGFPRNGYGIYLHEGTVDAKWFGEIRVGGTGYSVDGATDVADGEWHHLVFQRDGATLRTYEDGTLANTLTAVSTTVTNSAELRFGRSTFGAGYDYYLAGSWEDARIYQRALSGSEIALLYDPPAGGLTIPTVAASSNDAAVPGAVALGSVAVSSRACASADAAAPGAVALGSIAVSGRVGPADDVPTPGATRLGSLALAGTSPAADAAVPGPVGLSAASVPPRVAAAGDAAAAGAVGLGSTASSGSAADAGAAVAGSAVLGSISIGGVSAELGASIPGATVLGSIVVSQRSAAGGDAAVPGLVGGGGIVVAAVAAADEAPSAPGAVILGAMSISSAAADIGASVPGVVTRGSIVVSQPVAPSADGAVVGAVASGPVVVSETAAPGGDAAAPGAVGLSAVAVADVSSAAAEAVAPGAVSLGPVVVAGCVAGDAAASRPGTTIGGGEVVSRVVGADASAAVAGAVLIGGSATVSGASASSSDAVVPGQVVRGSLAIGGGAAAADAAVAGAVIAGGGIVVSGAVAGAGDAAAPGAAVLGAISIGGATAAAIDIAVAGLVIHSDIVLQGRVVAYDAAVPGTVEVSGGGGVTILAIGAATIGAVRAGDVVVAGRPRSRASILAALFSLISSLGWSAKRNAAIPGSIPDGGLVIMRDGASGAPDPHFSSTPMDRYQHAVELEIYYSSVSPPETAIYDLVAALRVALYEDRTLGGLVDDIIVGAETVEAIAIGDGAPIVVGSLAVELNYLLERHA